MSADDDLDTLHDEFARWSEQRKIVSEEDAGWEDSDDDGIRLLERIGAFLWCGEGARPTEPPPDTSEGTGGAMQTSCAHCGLDIETLNGGETWWDRGGDGCCPSVSEDPRTVRFHQPAEVF